MDDKLEGLRRTKPAELEQAIARARITRPHQLYPYQEVALRVECGLPIAEADSDRYFTVCDLTPGLYAEVLAHGVERMWAALTKMRGS